MADNEKINLFISYSHKDKEKKAFQELLTCLRTGNIIKKTNVFSDLEIQLGNQWDDTIQQNLKTADIVLLVLSADFLASDYINNSELKLALDRKKEGECEVIPLFFRYCDWKGYGFEDSQGFPTDKKYQSDEIKVITDMQGAERDLVLTAFKKKIDDLCDRIINKRKNSARMNFKQENALRNDPNQAAKLQAMPTAELQSKPAEQFLRSQDIIQNSKLVEGNDDVYAVLIANYKFSKLIDKDIPSVQTNLKELENTFRTDLKFKNVSPIDNKDSSNIQKELERIIKKCPGESTLLLYYSGHGLIESNSFYLASEDTELDYEDNNKLLKSSAVSAQNVKELLSE